MSICRPGLDPGKEENAADCESASLNDLQELNGFYQQTHKNFKGGLLNINSVRHKFYPLRGALEKNVLDVLCVQETKLDDSSPDVQFQVDIFYKTL